MAALKFWTWLTTLPGLSSRRLLLLEHFQSPEDIYYADTEELLLAEGMTRAQAELLGDKSLDRAERVLEECARKGAVHPHDAGRGLPKRLRGIYDPPVLLYGRARCRCLTRRRRLPSSALTRVRPTVWRWRRSSAMRWRSRERWSSPVWPAASTRRPSGGALRAGGLTAAVLGGGVDVVYPAENRRLYEDIAAVGVLLSEYPPGTEPRSGPLPRAQPHHERPDALRAWWSKRRRAAR